MDEFNAIVNAREPAASTIEANQLAGGGTTLSVAADPVTGSGREIWGSR
jgi:hypothetical protein